MHTNLFCSDKTKADSVSEQETQPSTSGATSPSETNHNQPTVASEAEAADAAEKSSAGKQISERKLAANRRNAQLSTGPKTTAGKNNSRRNAIKHGILERKILLPPNGQPCDHELAEFRDRLRAEYPGEDMYSEFLRDDILFAYSGYGKAIELGKDLGSQARWSRINWGDKLDRYLSTHRKALLHNFKELQKLEAERRQEEQEEAAAAEVNQQEVEVTGCPQNGEEDDVDHDEEYENAMLECEDYLYTPRSYYLDCSLGNTKRDWFTCDETDPADQVDHNVAGNCLKSSIDEDGKPSPSSPAEPASLAGTTQDLHERTPSNAISLEALVPSEVADALPPAEAPDELGRL